MCLLVRSTCNSTCGQQRRTAPSKPRAILTISKLVVTMWAIPVWSWKRATATGRRLVTSLHWVRDTGMQRPSWPWGPGGALKLAPGPSKGRGGNPLLVTACSVAFKPFVQLNLMTDTMRCDLHPCYLLNKGEREGFCDLP